MPSRARLLSVALLSLLIDSPVSVSAQNVALDANDSPQGYVAVLLINEVPFPGERSWESEADSKAAMRQILYVLDSRLHHIPPKYTQRQVAAVQTDDIITLMTTRGQIEGFYRDESGHPATALRVRERLDYLLGIANNGTPGTFARLLNYAQSLSRAYFATGLTNPDLFVDLKEVMGTPVTGRAYSWMTDVGDFHPGGRFVRITDDYDGSLGGNRFFTLQKLKR
ncbi:MAG TPA: hypothetical protein VFJ90_13940 [Candidatus Didemnitutus sp.]|nr:hypothetical protein [Candidatus Didemnitutus sp.]